MQVLVSALFPTVHCSQFSHVPAPVLGARNEAQQNIFLPEP